jgi:hypothetical protein
VLSGVPVYVYLHRRALRVAKSARADAWD